MTVSRFAGMGGHHSPVAKTHEWLTPPPIIAALGGWRSFDLDPCASIGQPWRTARRQLTVRDNGLLAAWEGRVWMNPPYSTALVKRWLARMAEHDHGVALIFARTETAPFFRFVWGRATALLFMRTPRLKFHFPDGSQAENNCGAPTVLCAYGRRDADILAGCSIAGQLVVLRLPVSMLVEAVPGTWREELMTFVGDRQEVDLDEAYRWFAARRKTVGRRHYKAKIRQQFQLGPFERVGRGRYRRKAGA